MPKNPESCATDIGFGFAGRVFFLDTSASEEAGVGVVKAARRK